MRHQNTVFHSLLKQIPWALFDGLVERHDADKDQRSITCKAHLIAMLLGQLCGARGLREIEANLQSHAGKLYHLGGCTVSKSALSTANASREAAAVFAGLLSALMGQLQAGYRRKVKDCIRLIDSTSVRLSGLSGKWARFSAGVCGAKAHIIYDPDADQPLYLMVTPSNINDITAAKEMPIEAGATYVFDLGYYDYLWWATLDAAGCRIVTRLKANTPFAVVEDRPVLVGSSILSDRTGYLPKRLAASRRNPMSGLVRELRVIIETGKVLRIFTNDLNASAQEIGDLYRRRWAIELFFRWVKQTLKISHFMGTSETAVRIQITIALVAFLLLRLAHEAHKIVASPLTFARLIRTNLMHRRAIADLLQSKPPSQPDQPRFDFGTAATRAAHRRRQARAPLVLRTAA
ncbi:IS4 family transposase [Mesorhizobium montanum]|uniref:IS4 family transposase n=1 Tax=Mesorhizobium montanum TaxID=3072323 RepID=UPI003D317684